MIANQAFAHFLGFDDVDALEGKNVHRTVLNELNPELHDDLRVVALNGRVVRRYLTLTREKPIRIRYILAPATGACGHCAVW